VQLDKQQIIARLTNSLHQHKAARADNDLPNRFDTDHGGLLDKLGINISDLLGGTGSSASAGCTSASVTARGRPRPDRLNRESTTNRGARHGG